MIGHNNKNFDHDESDDGNDEEWVMSYEERNDFYLVNPLRPSGSPVTRLFKSIYLSLKINSNLQTNFNSKCTKGIFLFLKKKFKMTSLS